MKDDHGNYNDDDDCDNDDVDVDVDDDDDTIHGILITQQARHGQHYQP